jgi:hypothetical protein
MTDLVLTGRVNLTGRLRLAGSTGTVQVDGGGGPREVVVETAPTGGPQGQGPPVVLPPPPASPLDTGPGIHVVSSFAKLVTVEVAGRPVAVVAQGIVLQGSVPTWPGTVLPSTLNTGVRVEQVPVNVVGDQVVVFPSGAAVQLTTSGQS